MLRLNSNLERSLLFMHTSHRSHSSHSSHASHASHYSSSSSYSAPSSPSTPVRTTTPVTPVYTPPASIPKPTHLPRSIRRSATIMSTVTTKSDYKGTNPISPSTLEIIGYHYRDLYKGCEGIDVECLQKLLKAAGYETPTTGYFGDKTEQSVKKFQNENELKPNGKVDDKTHSILKAKVDEV